MRVLVTGSSGLIGSEAVVHFAGKGHQVGGLDNNLRRHFFGEDGDTTWVRAWLVENVPGYVHRDIDVRDRQAVLAVVEEIPSCPEIHRSGHAASRW